MPTTGKLYVGITAPQKATFTITSDGLDLQTVTSVAWEVTRPRGGVHVWLATIASATPTRLVSEHVHAPGDVPELGKYRIRPLLTTPAGVVPGVAVETVVTY